MARFRYNFVNSIVAFARNGDGRLVHYAMGRVFDIFLERVRQSTLARFPSKAVNQEAIGLVGTSRGFTRGSLETDETYKQRLQEWLTPGSLRTRGGYYAFLRQVALALQVPAGTRVKVVCRNGFWVQYDNNVITFGFLVSGVTFTNNGFWVGSGAPAMPPAFGFVYVVIENHPNWSLPSGLLLGDPALWGGALGATDEVIGLGGATYREISDLRQLVKEWRPLGIDAVELLFNAAPGSAFPQTGVDGGSAGAPNYTTAVSTNLVRLPL